MGIRLGEIADVGVDQSFARVVADDADHLHGQLADAHPVEQVGQAVVELADHQDGLAQRAFRPQRPVHSVFVGQRDETGTDCRDVGRAAIELDPHEERILILVAELLRIEDVGAMRVEITGDARGDARLVAARQGQYLDIGHRRVSLGIGARQLKRPLHFRRRSLTSRPGGSTSCVSLKWHCRPRAEGSDARGRQAYRHSPKV